MCYLTNNENKMLLHIISEHSAVITYPLMTGVLASIIHVLSGPDHLAAVAPLSVEKRSKTWKIGLYWGLGHLSGMLLIGVLLTLFRSYIPVEKISEHSEQLVGLVLIAIGLWSFYKIKTTTQKEHQHPHVHYNDDENLVHIHKHEHGVTDTHTHHHEEKKKKHNGWAAYSIGTLHGLAGISHFLLFLPTLTFESNYDSGLYLGGFAIGTIIAMTLFSVILGKIAQKASLNHKDRLFTGIRFGAGFFALAVGIYWFVSAI